MDSVDTYEALEALVEELLSRGATDLVQEIRQTIARGTTRTRREGKKGQEVFLQEPLSDEEAFVVAVELILAALEPPFMLLEASKLLGVPGGEDLVWMRDLLQAGEHHEEISGPDTIDEERIQVVQDSAPIAAGVRQVRELLCELRQHVGE